MEGDAQGRKSCGQPTNFYPRPPSGGRPSPGRRLAPGDQISIHALRVEGDQSIYGEIQQHFYFYPRPPSGGRPHTRRRRSAPKPFLSTPSEWRATVPTPFGIRIIGISIHALRVEGDRQKQAELRADLISIHALRVEGDQISVHVRTSTKDFYPRPPSGGRQQKRTKFSSVFAQKGEEFASLRRGKRKFAGGVLKRTNFGL